MSVSLSKFAGIVCAVKLEEKAGTLVGSPYERIAELTGTTEKSVAQRLSTCRNPQYAKNEDGTFKIVDGSRVIERECIPLPTFNRGGGGGRKPADIDGALHVIAEAMGLTIDEVKAMQADNTAKSLKRVSD
jgi:hypothetical protein